MGAVKLASIPSKKTANKADSVDVNALPGSELEASLRRKKQEMSSYDDDDEVDNNNSDSSSDSSSDSDSDHEEAGAGSESKTKSTSVSSSEHEYDHTRRNKALNRCAYVLSITDSKHNPDTGDKKNKHLKWVEVVVNVALTEPKLLLMGMVEAVCEKVLLRAHGSLGNCTALHGNTRISLGSGKGNNDKEWYVQCEGVDFNQIWALSLECGLDPNRLYSNDIGAIRKAYGVEAARNAIESEIKGVFGVYGINVDPRHLGLLADYMTFNGGYRPLNRMGINSNPSPFQKISFETSMNFMLDASLFGDVDHMTSPSSKIVMGAPVRAGTGSFGIRQMLNPQ